MAVPHSNALHRCLTIMPLSNKFVAFIGLGGGHVRLAARDRGDSERLPAARTFAVRAQASFSAWRRRHGMTRRRLQRQQVAATDRTRAVAAMEQETLPGSGRGAPRVERPAAAALRPQVGAVRRQQKRGIPRFQAATEPACKQELVSRTRNVPIGADGTAPTVLGGEEPAVARLEPHPDGPARAEAGRRAQLHVVDVEAATAPQSELHLLCRLFDVEGQFYDRALPGGTRKRRRARSWRPRPETTSSTPPRPCSDPVTAAAIS